ncbi:response regulator transcription factor [Neorhizobium sp. JUb45]|uniref:response regulator n=1 Tax=unclassified Neorhizobium TaxID=2629175 RepID=UPI00105212F1|nr:response regulator transcription factor [Neorhizobium sp. JUb45]TCR06146.1 two-component system OmpR family response regulator [Neorhizobium sp. JUb45]
MNDRHILIVEDDRDIRTLLTEFLTGEGFAVSAAETTSAAEKLMVLRKPDLVVLDLMLPGEDGLSFCRRLRGKNSDLPILMLTARDEEIDRIVGLEMGADDYLGKPFNPRELLARIRAILRRGGLRNGAAEQVNGSAAEGPSRKAFCGLVLDLDARTVGPADEEGVFLTSAEFDLLMCFLERPRRVLSRDQLLDWTRSRVADPFDRTIDVTMSRLRNKLTPLMPPGQAFITTVRSAGYMLSAQVTDA